MSKAEDIVRARQEAERAEAARAAEQKRADELRDLRRKLKDGIPRLVAVLERRNYPDAKLVDVPE